MMARSFMLGPFSHKNAPAPGEDDRCALVRGRLEIRLTDIGSIHSMQMMGKLYQNDL